MTKLAATGLFRAVECTLIANCDIHPILLCDVETGTITTEVDSAWIFAVLDLIEVEKRMVTVLA